MSTGRYLLPSFDELMFISGGSFGWLAAALYGCGTPTLPQTRLGFISFCHYFVIFSFLVGPRWARLRQRAVKYLISHSSQGWFPTSQVVLYLCSRAGRLELPIFIGISGDNFLWDLPKFKKSSSKCLKSN